MSYQPTMSILLINWIHGSANPHCYSSPVIAPLKEEEVIKALDDIDWPTGDELVERIVQELKRNRFYWLGSDYVIQYLDV